MAADWATGSINRARNHGFGAKQTQKSFDPSTIVINRVLPRSSFESGFFNVSLPISYHTIPYHYQYL